MVRTQLEKNFLYQWGMLAVAIVLIAGPVVHNLYKSYTDILDGERSRLLTQARVINENLANRLSGTDRVLTGMRNELSCQPVERWGSIYPPNRLELLNEAYSGIRTLLVFDRNGIVRLASRPQLVGTDFSGRDYFRLAKKQPDPQRLYVSRPFTSQLNTWVITLTRVIVGPDGSFVGIVAATIDPDYFHTLLSSVNYAPDMWSAIVHEEGDLFLMKPDNTAAQGKNLRKAGTKFSAHIESGRPVNLFSGAVYATGDQRMLALANVNPASLHMDKILVVATSRSLSAITKGWRTHALHQAIIFCMVSLASTVALAGFQRYQRSHLKQAEQADVRLRDTQRQLSEIIDFLPDATFVLDKEQRVVIWNRAIEEMTGIPKEQMIGQGNHACTVPFYGERRKHLINLLDVDDAELAAKYAGVKRHGQTLGAEAFCPALYGGKGSYVWAVAAPLYDSNGERVGAVESIRDISEQKAVEAAMLQNQEYLRKLYHGIENSASAVMITDFEGNIEYVNRKFVQVTGYGVDEAIGKTPRILKSEATPREVFEDLWRTIRAGSEWRGELLNRRKNGEVYWSVASISPLRDDDGRITHFIANVEDINDRKNAEATIEHLAYYDPLTELPNRRMMQDRLDLALKRSRRQGVGMALLYLDLDSFKHINDSLGHPAGDALLREMSKRYLGLLRDDDIVCRLGGDEFAVILHDIRRNEDAMLVAEKLLAHTARPVLLDAVEVVTTASIGVALFPKDGDDNKTLEKHADIALYHAKAEGKNTFRFFSEELNSASRDRMALESALRSALEREELVLFYQPKIDLTLGCVIGVEALLRWNSPIFGMVSPNRFIPLAEETRAIIPIGEWVLRTACRQQVAWKQQGYDLTMAVNLSAVQFKSSMLISQVSAIIAETGVNADSLELELTESALVEKPDEGVRILKELRALGCGVSIDDFGTGYSSLNYLKNFPVTVLKIDQSFVRDLADDPGDRAIAQSIVALARNLDMNTVAEGVEQPEQQQILQELGCNCVQGFLYSRPVPAEQIPDAIRLIEQQWRAELDRRKVSTVRGGRSDELPGVLDVT